MGAQCTLVTLLIGYVQWSEAVTMSLGTHDSSDVKLPRETGNASCNWSCWLSLRTSANRSLISIAQHFNCQILPAIASSRATLKRLVTSAIMHRKLTPTPTPSVPSCHHAGRFGCIGEQQSDSPVDKAIGAAIAGGLLCLLCVWIGFWFWRRRHRSQSTELSPETNITSHSHDSDYGSRSGSSSDEETLRHGTAL